MPRKYEVHVRGSPPDDLAERISALHAGAIIQGSEERAINAAKTSIQKRDNTRENGQNSTERRVEDGRIKPRRSLP